jgi:peptide/nickel transport system substrate-binding protein
MAVANKIYEPLVRYGEDTVWAPELAHSWDSSPDGLKWTFHIYENATWHDGQPITSDDILFTYDTFVERHPTGVIFADVVDSVEAPDEYTFVMNFKYVHAGWRLNLPMLSIIPKHIFDVSGIDILDNEATRKPYVGSGAFKFVEWKAGEYIKLVRNDNFYQKKLPYLDEAYIIFAPDAQTLAAMFENGDIDDTTANGGGVPLADIALWRENPIAGKYPGTDGNLKYATTRFMLNCDPEYSKYTSQIKFRQAMAYALDYDRIIRDQTLGIMPRCYTVFPQGGANSWSYNPNAKHYDYDPDMANLLLDELGYAWDSNNEWRIDPDTGDPVTIKYVMGFDPSPLHLISMENWEDVGIMIDDFRLAGQASLSKVFTDFDYDVFFWGAWTGPDVSHTEEWLGSKYIMKGGMWVNGGRYSNPEVDELFEKAYKTLDQDERQEYYWQIQDILGEEIPLIPVYDSREQSVVSQAFKGRYWPNKVSGAQDPIKWVWWVYGELPAVVEPPVVVVPDTGDLEEKVEAIENAVNQLSSQVSGVNSEISDLSSKIEALESQAGAGGTGMLTYVSLLLALVAIGAAYYFGTRR